MSHGRQGWAAALVLAGSVTAPRAPAAQISATLDAGVSRVEYDGFLPSGAVSVTPALRVDRRSWSLTARGSLLRFESGNQSLQGLVAGAAFTPPLGSWRGEIAATAGASTYRQFPAISHLLGRARIHLIMVDHGGWLGASAGRTSFGTAGNPIAVYSAGAWTRRLPVAIDLSFAHIRVGDTTFTDFEASGRGTRGQVELEGLVGWRGWSRGGGEGAYGEAHATLPLLHRLAFVIGAGRYPSDPTRGSVAGRYFSAGLRVTGLTTRAPARFHFSDPGEATNLGTNGHFAAATLEIRPRRGPACTVVIRAAWARELEIMGDFTDWQPVPLTRMGDGTWEITLAIPAGVHRLNVRLDGGDWSVPRGATLAEDEFGGRVGTIVVP